MVSSLIIAALFAGLIFFSAIKRNSNPAPEFEKYEYSDIQGNRYLIVLRKGSISDSSFLYNEKDSLVESIDWSKSGSIRTKDKSKPDSKKHSTALSGQRSTESILKVIRKNTPDLIRICNKHRSYGKVILRFEIAPSGNIFSLYLVGNTTGSQKFALEIIKEVNSWGFENVDQNMNDVVTVPFTFSQ